jgi:hypothetical protein
MKFFGSPGKLELISRVIIGTSAIGSCSPRRWMVRKTGGWFGKQAEAPA